MAIKRQMTFSFNISQCESWKICYRHGDMEGRKKEPQKKLKRNERK